MKQPGEMQSGGPEEEFAIDRPQLSEEIAGAAFTSGNYPYEKPMKRKRYEKELEALQIELLKVQRWVGETGKRIVIIFEGRDSAGKGGAIKRFAEHLNPRHVKVVALPKPSETERGQWYFQRYVAHLPTAGEIALFDRSWYNRAGVEPVMGFCSERETAEFHIEAPRFEEMLVRDGIIFFKYWLTIGREMQLKRLHARRHDPLKTWKLSPIDLAAPEKWDDYTDAVNDMMLHTHSAIAPWTVVRANDKKRARLAVIRHFLFDLDYDGKDGRVVGEVDDAIVLSGKDFTREI